MVLTFSEEISKESVDHLIEKLSSVEEDSILYFSTIGGCVISSEALLTYLNVYKRDTLTIIFTADVCSMGAYIMFNFAGKKFLSETLDVVLIHTIDRQAYNNRLTKLDRILDESLKKLSVKYFDRMSKHFKFTKKEKKKYFSGRDITLTPQDFHRINIPFWNIEDTF